MKTNSAIWTIAIGCVALIIAQPAFATNVKVTPPGGQEGEFCPQDRALIFIPHASTDHYRCTRLRPSLI